MDHTNFDVAYSAADNVLAALRETVDDDLPFYTDSLSAAFRDFQPVFTAERYADFFLECAARVPGWIAGSVLVNGKKESDGAESLFRLWKAVTFDEAIEERLLFHVHDEARHARVFVRLATLAFPHLVAPHEGVAFARRFASFGKAQQVKSDSVRVTEDVLLDYLVQTNLAEIRTRINVKLMAPVIWTSAPLPAAKDEVEEILGGLVSDEEVHVGYTAKYLNKACAEGAARRVRDLFARRLRDFNEFTLREIEAAVRAYGRGQYPELLNM